MEKWPAELSIPRQDQKEDRMKITDLKAFLVDRYLLVRVYTDKGIIGNGEAGLWAHHPTVAEAIRELSDYFVGKDPRLIEHHYQVISRNTHFMGAALSAAQSAIDVALWDILGKSVGLPVYQLLGGKCRDKVKVFNNVTGNSIESRVESALKSVNQGFLSLRMNPFLSGFEEQTATSNVSTAAKMVGAVREAIGDDIDLGLEIHRNLNPDAAILLAHELEPFRILYYEDPLAPQSVDALEYIAQRIKLPIAAGERCHNIYQFKDLVDRKILSLIRPDVSLAGGFTQVKKIAATAEAAFIGIFPHLMGSPVNNAAFTHLAAAIPNYTLMEVNTHSEQIEEIVDTPLKTDSGYREVSDRPGIGVEIQEDKLAGFPALARSVVGNFAADGSVAH